MQRFKLAAQAQRFLAVHGLVGNLFRLGRHLLRAAHHRFFRERAFQLWNAVMSAWTIASVRRLTILARSGDLLLTNRVST